MEIEDVLHALNETPQSVRGILCELVAAVRTLDERLQSVEAGKPQPDTLSLPHGGLAPRPALTLVT